MVISVDESRLRMIESMTQDQRDMFLIGMSYHSAHLSFEDRSMGKQLSSVCSKELEMVIEAMNRQGLVSKINKC